MLWQRIPVSNNRSIRDGNNHLKDAEIGIWHKVGVEAETDFKTHAFVEHKFV